ITTNIKANGEEITEGFGLIESWRVVRETKSGRMSELKVRLSDWVYRIIQGSEVLTLSRDYFRQCLPFGSTVKTGIRGRVLDKCSKPWHSKLDECG
ncbi:MAG: replication initiator protein A, partial [Candidatus Sulfotelmatobacter sp.]